PALNAARDRAKSITCTNNLKNMGTQNVFYADSYDGYLVGVNLPGIGWWAANRAFRTLLGGELWDSDSPLKCQEWASTRIVCPKAMRALTPALWGVTGDRASLHYSYGMTPEESANLSAAWKQFGSPLNVLAYKLARIRNASARLMFADSNGIVVQNSGSTLLNTMRRMNDNAESNAVMFRHSQKGNIVMMDGHVEALSEAEVRVGADNNRKLWYGFYE
ncbi:MAG: H-X9-DG-CTERM domain-containing protein, partial [Victivallis vadensis]